MRRFLLASTFALLAASTVGGAAAGAGSDPAAARPGAPTEPGSNGRAVKGDFNGDGFGDLAVGVPYSDVSAAADAGAINVIYGSSTGLSGTAGPGAQYWNQNKSGVPDTAETGDLFGATLATGDFDGDGFVDLAIGVPSEDVGTVVDAGAVNILYGASSGLGTSGAQFWTENTNGVLETAETGDSMGTALTGSDFGGTSQADLAIGVPGESTNSRADSGAVIVLVGSSASGLTATNSQIWTQNSTNVPDSVEAGDAFGSALATGDFGSTSQFDLAVGVPGEAVGSVAGAGAVNVIPGSSSGLTGTGSQYWNQDSSGISDTAESGDAFGSALAASKFGGASQADLAIGVPGENVSNTNDSGAVSVLYGASSGLTSSGNQYWNENKSGIPETAEDNDAFGSALATGDFDDDGFNELAVGVPGESVSGVSDAGAAIVIPGSSSGLVGTGSSLWSQDGAVVPDDPESGDDFGAALGTGPFDSGNEVDLVAGVPGEDVGSIVDGGAIIVFYGSGSGLTTSGSQYLDQDSAGVPDTVETGDGFGAWLTPR